MRNAIRMLSEETASAYSLCDGFATCICLADERPPSSFRVPETIRGFGRVKEANIKLAAAEKARLEAELENSRSAAAAE